MKELKEILPALEGKRPVTFKLKESSGFAYKKSNYYPDVIDVSFGVYEATDSRIYQSNSWCVYSLKPLTFILD